MTDGHGPVLGGWPTVVNETVFHVGLLDPSLKGTQHASSYEGAGLSVSDHPDEWEAIARLGGAPHWQLECEGAEFLDVHALDGRQRGIVEQWAVDNGYATRLEGGWELSWYDSERDDRLAMWFTTKDAADDEFDGYDEGVEPRLEPVELLGPTERLRAHPAGNPCSDPSSASDDAVMVFAHDELGLDGVWWYDTYDPAALSCPRGVIFADRVGRWEALRVRGPALRAADGIA